MSREKELLTEAARERLVRPIGVLSSPHAEKFDAPRQPRAALGVEGTIELFPGFGYEDALADLAGWQYVWVLAWFDRNDSWRPKVFPPRSRVKRGVFSTRSPHRPNPIALSVFELVSVEGRTVRVRNVDLLDGTPVLDLKPYVPWTDAIPEAGVGWLASEGAGPADPGPRYEVRLEPLAEAGLAYLREHGIELEPKLRAALSLGPAPHAYRRIRKQGDHFVLGIRDFRARFRAEGDVVTVFALDSGCKERELAGSSPDLVVHRELRARFSREPGAAD